MASVRHPVVSGRQINADDYDDEHIVELDAADITGALGYTPADADDLSGYATDAELAAEAAARAAADAALDATKSNTGHTHDDLYYTETEVDALLAGVGGSDWFIRWLPGDNEPPTTNFATYDVRNGHPVLDFDTTTQEAAIFTGILPPGYSGAGVTVSLWFAATSATTGTIGWDVAFERVDTSSLDIDADSFGSATTITAATVPGTSGQVLKQSVNVSNGANMDSAAAGEMIRLRIRRDVANDTATGDAELLAVLLVSQ